MERSECNHDPSENFDHPRLPIGHRLLIGEGLQASIDRGVGRVTVVPMRERFPNRVTVGIAEAHMRAEHQQVAQHVQEPG